VNARWHDGAVRPGERFGNPARKGGKVLKNVTPEGKTSQPDQETMAAGLES
jgi:hypothetical protein